MTIFWILYAAFWGTLIGVNIGLCWWPLTDAIETRYWEWYRTHHAPSFVMSDETARAMSDAMRLVATSGMSARAAADAMRRMTTTT